MQELSGDISVAVNGVSRIIKSRNTTYSTSDIEVAAEYIKNKLSGYGLAVSEQPFTFLSGGITRNAKNIVAVQQGSQYPSKKFIICAHYDDMPSTGIAPGADDNASGTAGVIEAARVLSKHHPKYTIVYALFSGEEQGLKGSYYYSQQAAAANEDIQGVINLDMIAWNSTGKDIVEIEYRNLSSAKQPFMDNLLSKLSYVNQYYGFNMTLSKFNNATGGSDHYPFLLKDYPAFLMIEDWANHNSNYHKITDTFSTLYYDYFEKCSKLAITTLAELALTENLLGVEDRMAMPSDFILYQNYPNPFNPSTTIKFTIPAVETGHAPSLHNISLKVYDSLGREIVTLVNEVKGAGSYSVEFNGKNLPSGIYYYRLTGGSSNASGKMTLLK